MPKILLVEDNQEIREMLERRLKKRNFDVVLGVNGQEACTLARSEQPDLILMDMEMPIMDGREATKHLKAAADTQAIPIIALTAGAMAGDREKAIEAGCNDYETKPIDMSALLDKMQKLLPQRSSS